MQRKRHRNIEIRLITSPACTQIQPLDQGIPLKKMIPVISHQIFYTSKASHAVHSEWTPFLQQYINSKEHLEKLHYFREHENVLIKRIIH